ncbi:glycosyltransferase family 32 protein [Agathobacter sp.]
MSIPKIIHYCWFGGNPMPEEYKEYIESWKKYMPEYEIKEWNETNFNFDNCDYAKEAYEAKKWAFVSDYARFKILYENGGIYFDTDVEIINSLDHIVSQGSFMGIEKFGEKNKAGIAPGLGLGCNPGLGLYREILEHYKQIHFLNEDGTYNLCTVVQYVTSILKKHGFVEENKLQKIANITIYPADVFGPMDCETGKINITNNTVSIHHYAASWADDTTKFKKKIQSIIGPKLTSLIIQLKRKVNGK